MYMIVAKKIPGGRWHPYGSRLFDNKKEAVSGIQVGISIYPDMVFSISYIGDEIDWEKSAVGQTK